MTSGDAILGLISEREIVHAYSRYGETVASMPVRNIIAQGMVTVTPDDDLNHVMRLMTRHRVRHVPVLSNRKLVGIVSIGDVVKRRLDDIELEANVLRDAYLAKDWRSPTTIASTPTQTLPIFPRGFVRDQH